MENIVIEKVFEEEMKVQINGKIKNILELSVLENTYLNVYWDNQKEGELHLIDGIECDICKNKGYIYCVGADGNDYQVECECQKQRKTLIRLNNCGITKEMLDKYTFGKYECENEWQKEAKTLFLEFCKDIASGNKYFIYYGGISGSGKTHLCTATFQKLIKSNMTGYYMLWNKEIPNILALEKSTYEDNQIKYYEKIKFLENIDVLYIDDFLKLTNNKYSNDSLSLAYKIINSRYNNNKITIISSEYLVNQLNELDMATCSRIYEKAKNGKYMFDCGNEKNKNYRYKENK